MRRKILISEPPKPKPKVVNPLNIINWTQASIRFKIRVRADGDLTSVYGIHTDLSQSKKLILETFASKQYTELTWIYDSSDNEYRLMGKRPPTDKFLILSEIEILDHGGIRSLEVWLNTRSEEMDPANNEGFEGLGSLFS